MYFTGFADEAAKGIDGQIAATKALGWDCIESRAIDGTNIHDITDEEFDVVYGKLQDAGVKINCFGSCVANWAKQVDESFDSSLEETKRAIPRMQRLGTKLIRVMSFAWFKDRDVKDQMAEERFRRLRILVDMFQEAGIQPVHENCMNFGGLGWPWTLEMVENVPGLKLVFDTGNPVGADDRMKDAPYPKQSSWEFYDHVKEHIAYVHIKDGHFDATKDDLVCTWPGEGKGDVRRIVGDLLANGYDGGFSMEPHMAVIFHDASVVADPKVMFDNYVEYGQRFMKLVDECKQANA
jgi:sugar phosphate isomerase/epimerase